MSRGHDRHQERHHGLSLFGKDLVRRCSSHCELCDAQGVGLRIFEVPPVPVEPDLEHCIMICDSCREQIERPKRRDPNYWRCLNGSVWSTVPAVKVMALAMLAKIAEQERWAVELQEQVYLEADEQAWLDQVELD
jgi:protein PhnA